ncbi:uncharacterized protein LOC111869808 isoform X1 [Cryptotermes secundus]|uniref:uncharacterized protein LOC111869808 isoform X1 n=1 Tax=Cryptotermes secundus TaxID=105785 RepID=UPI000CD7BA21|nr:uncharacterized protein LOC111869808 isoform X1 [Cryptotermes secundus]
MLMEKDREIITLKSEKESEVKAVKNQYELITRPRSTVTTAFQTNINMAEQDISQRWISRDGPMPWPPSSPDITPLDSSLWGYIKSSVFRTPVNGLDDLKTHIRNAISAIPADMFHRTW